MRQRRERQCFFHWKNSQAHCNRSKVAPLLLLTATMHKPRHGQPLIHSTRESFAFSHFAVIRQTQNWTTAAPINSNKKLCTIFYHVVTWWTGCEVDDECTGALDMVDRVFDG